MQSCIHAHVIMEIRAKCDLKKNQSCEGHRPALEIKILITIYIIASFEMFSHNNWAKLGNTINPLFMSSRMLIEFIVNCMPSYNPTWQWLNAILQFYSKSKDFSIRNSILCHSHMCLIYTFTLFANTIFCYMISKFRTDDLN